MPERAERLWPSKGEQPQMTSIIDGQSFTFRWDNTYIQHYRTNIPKYDDQLKDYSHVVLEVSRSVDSEGNIKRDFTTIPLDKFSKKELTYLIENAYPISSDPVPAWYVLDEIAEAEAVEIPDFIE